MHFIFQNHFLDLALIEWSSWAPRLTAGGDPGSSLQSFICSCDLSSLRVLGRASMPLLIRGGFLVSLNLRSRLQASALFLHRACPQHGLGSADLKLRSGRSFLHSVLFCQSGSSVMLALGRAASPQYTSHLGDSGELRCELCVIP